MSPGHARFTESSIIRLRDFRMPNVDVDAADMFNWLRELFTAKDRTTNSELNKVDSDSLYANNDDVILGYKFSATLHLSTPLYVLEHHGEIFKGLPSHAPTYGSESEGIWLPEINPEYNLGADIITDCASDIGPINENEYLPFLMDFRAIIESNDTHHNQLEGINKLVRLDKYLKVSSLIHKTHKNFPHTFFYRQLIEVPGIGIKAAQNVYEAGLISIDDLLSADETELLKIKGIGKEAVRKIKQYKR